MGVLRSGGCWLETFDKTVLQSRLCTTHRAKPAGTGHSCSSLPGTLWRDSLVLALVPTYQGLQVSRVRTLTISCLTAAEPCPVLPGHSTNSRPPLLRPAGGAGAGCEGRGADEHALCNRVCKAAQLRAVDCHPPLSAAAFPCNPAGAAFRDCPAPAPGSLTSSTGQALPSVAALLAAAPQLSTFRDALRAGNLSAVPGGSLTVFAPSNAAFTAALLSGQLWQTLGTGAAAAAGAGGPGSTPAKGPAVPSTAADGATLPQQPAAMQAVLLDHLAAGRYELADLEQLASCNATVGGGTGPASGAAAAGTPDVAAATCPGSPLVMLSGRQALVAVGPDGESQAGLGEHFSLEFGACRRATGSPPAGAPRCLLPVLALCCLAAGVHITQGTGDNHPPLSLPHPSPRVHTTQASSQWATPPSPCQTCWPATAWCTS